MTPPLEENGNEGRPSGESSPPAGPSLEREAVFQREFIEDLNYWVDKDRKTALKVFDLIKQIMRDPFTGTGRPEQLKHWDTNAWSRRLTGEHRIVYLVSEDRIDFLQARYHY